VIRSLPRPVRWILGAIGALLGAALVYWLVIFVIVWRDATTDSHRHGDAIIVLGAAQYNGRPSDDLRFRLDHALALWREHVAPTIVVTGGKQPGDRFTEAATGAVYLHDHGVPNTAILREVQGRSSWESLEAAARFLQARHLRRVTLVSDAYHSARIDDIAADVGLDPVTSPTHFIHGVHIVPYLFRESIRVAAGRLIGYGVLQRHGRVGKLLPGLAIMVVPLRRSPNKRSRRAGRPNRG
jgi:uncharacterized SAM-binding protein YcdF (DUF218 family)